LKKSYFFTKRFSSKQLMIVLVGIYG